MGYFLILLLLTGYRRNGDTLYLFEYSFLDPSNSLVCGCEFQRLFVAGLSFLNVDSTILCTNNY